MKMNRRHRTMANIEIINSTEGGGSAFLTYTVHSARHVNIDTVQKA